VRSVVSETAATVDCAFKLAAGQAELIAINNGDFGWNQIGKVATIYISNSDRANDAAALLEKRLVDIEGPIVEGDIRVSQQAPIYARWGSFFTPKHDPQRGGRVTTVDGRYQTDDRTRTQHEHLGRPAPFSYIEHRPPLEPWGDRFVPVEVIGVTRVSAIYTSIDTLVMAPCILKVRRKYACYDSKGFDGVHRLEREYQALQIYGDLLSGPKPLGLVHERGRTALATEMIRGTRLDHYMGQAANRKRLATQLARIVQMAHNQSVLIRDLRAENIIVDDSSQIRMIDFEFVGPLESSEFNCVTTDSHGASNLVHSFDSERRQLNHIVAETLSL
jgi:tRNA A-37 threonylcarbamoyl transferase component Bud32